jgi:hypothetical protein
MTTTTTAKPLDLLADSRSIYRTAIRDGLTAGGWIADAGGKLACRATGRQLVELRKLADPANSTSPKAARIWPLIEAQLTTRQGEEASDTLTFLPATAHHRDGHPLLRIVCPIGSGHVEERLSQGLREQLRKLRVTQYALRAICANGQITRIICHDHTAGRDGQAVGVLLAACPSALHR